MTKNCTILFEIFFVIELINYKLFKIVNQFFMHEILIIYLVTTYYFIKFLEIFRNF